MKRIAIALLCSSCSSGALPIFLIDARDEPGFELVDDVCEYWSIDCEESTDDHAPMTVLLIDVAGEGSDARPHCGQTERDKCDVFIFSCNDPIALKHEFGHAFGLQHRSDPDNIMHEDIDHNGGVSNTGQRTIVRNGAAKLARCD